MLFKKGEFMCLKKLLSLSSFLLLVACGGDSENSSAPTDFDEEIESSSSQKSVSSSSSVKDQKSSSSSVVKVVSSSSSIESSSSDEKESSSSSAVDEQSRSSSSKPVVIAIKDKSFSGIAEKGPFTSGSKVTIYELDSDFTQTDNSYTTEIDIDYDRKAFSFAFSDVTLANPYALLEVNGFFYNEMNGKLSENKITLKALSDLSNRDKVNINLLTHLEYKRVLFLIGTGMNFADAKKQAETEVLNAFGIKGEFANSEDLENFGRKDENAALLAMSVLVLIDGEEKLVDNLNCIAADIEKDGSWDDGDSKARFADLAQEKDLTGALDGIHTTLRKWNVGWVPDFEKYVRNYWYENYGLDECNSNNKGEILDVKNEHSAAYASKTRFICKDSVWMEATEIEKQFGAKKGEDGEFLTGPESGRKYKYDENLNEWLYASAMDEALNNACTNKRIGLTDKDEKEKLYYCSANGWSSPADGWNWDVPPKYRFNPAISYGEMTDTRDGKKYAIVEIGEGEKKQIWMAENLNYYKASDSTLNGHSWCFGTKESDQTAVCDVAGRLYSWSAAVAKEYEKCGQGRAYCDIGDEIVQGACPSGWHLPKYEEWELLFENVGGKKTAAKYLKSQTGWANCDACLDAVGFSALPVGYKIYESWFNYAGQSAVFWSSTSPDAIYAYQVYLGDMWDSADFWTTKKDGGFSVRCVKD